MPRTLVLLPTALLTALLPLGACYRYVADPAGASPASNTELRVEIAPEGAAQVTTALGPRVRLLEGPAVSADDSTLTISVRSITRSPESEERWNGDPVRIPRSAIARVERRRFDAVKSVLIAGGIVGGALLAARGGTEAPTTGISGGGSSGAK